MSAPIDSSISQGGAGSPRSKRPRPGRCAQELTAPAVSPRAGAMEDQPGGVPRDAVAPPNDDFPFQSSSGLGQVPPLGRLCSIEGDLVRWLSSDGGGLKSPSLTPRAARDALSLSRDPSINKLLFSPPVMQRQESLEFPVKESDRDSPSFLHFVSTCLSPITKIDSSEAMAEPSRSNMLKCALKRSWSDRSLGQLESPGQGLAKQPRLEGVTPVNTNQQLQPITALLENQIGASNKPIDAPWKASDMKPPRPCKCRKSKCLKLYCECFSTGSFCSYECSCIDCGNTCDNPEAVARAQNPRPRLPKTQGPGSCRCKRSGCQKKYCECYQAKAACTDRCQCMGCRNTAAERLRFSQMIVKDSTGAITFVPQILHPAPS